MMTIDRYMPVLVVDDHGTMIKVVRGQLRQLGFADIDEANSGAEALTKLCTRRYGLIFSDWHMEPLSGLDLLIAIRGDASLKQTPFIMVTGESRSENVIAASWDALVDSLEYGMQPGKASASPPEGPAAQGAGSVRER